eukprot:313405-Pyramimonas_sp.AAC.2
MVRDLLFGCHDAAHQGVVHVLRDPARAALSRGWDLPGCAARGLRRPPRGLAALRRRLSAASDEAPTHRGDS